MVRRSPVRQDVSPWCAAVALRRRSSRASAVAAVLALTLGGAAGVGAADFCSPDDPQPGGGPVYRLCVPPDPLWNGDLVVFAHGYVAPGEPVGIPDDQLVLPDGTSIPGIINSLGYAFATTSYPANGLVFEEGVADLRELVDYFAATKGTPAHVYLVGISEGAAIATLALERDPLAYSGGLAACGPIGDFRRQIDYLGDFRVLFDYYFPGVLPGSAVDVPDELMANWEPVYVPTVLAALQARPAAALELLRVARASFDSADPASVAETVLGVLWYNVHATEDATDKLGGQPFDNRWRLYTGSGNDFRLNLLVERHRADPAALAEIEADYQTTGRLAVPVVTLHTTEDPVVPYFHEPRYRLKTWLAGSGWQHVNIPVVRYGHCRFETDEALAAFGLLVFRVTGRLPTAPFATLARR